MTAPALTITGDVEIERMFAQLGDEVGTEVIRRGAVAGGHLVALDAGARAPRGATGRLAGTMHEEVIEEGVGFIEVAVGPDRSVWYGHFPEGGTDPHELGKGFHGGIRAQRFLQTALDENVAGVVAGFVDELRAAVDAAEGA